MYKGRRFTRDQLVFVVDTILVGATDKIESCLPPVIPVAEALERRQEIESYIDGVLHTVAMQLPVLYAQLTDDGMGSGDFTQYLELEDKVNKYILGQLKMEGTYNAEGVLDVGSLAEDFVDEFLADYILGG